MIMITPVIIISIIVVSFFFGKIENDTEKLNIKVLEQVNSGMDTIFKRAVATSYQLVGTEPLMDLLHNKYTDDAVRNVQLWKIKKSISAYCMEGDIIVNAAIYSNINDILVDINTVYNIEEYYDRFLYDSDFSYEKFYSLMTGDLLKPMFISANDSILYLSGIKDSNNKNVGIYIATLSKQGIGEKFENEVSDSQVGFALMDDNGKLIFETKKFNIGFCDKISDMEYGINRRGANSLLKYHSASIRNLDYIYTFVGNNLSGNVRKMLWMFLMLLFLSVIVSSIFAKKNMRSMRDIVKYIFEENTALGKNLERQIEKSREQVLFNLLHGNNVHDFECGINFAGEKLCVMLTKVVNYDIEERVAYTEELSILEKKINDFIIKYFEKTDIGCCSVSERVSEYIYIIDYNTSEHMQTLLNELRDEFIKTYNINMIFGVGKETDNINHISESYERASAAVRYAAKLYGEKGGIAYYENIKENENAKMYYTEDKENQLIKSINMGLSDETEKIFDDIYNINFKEKQLSSGAIRQLVLSILNTMYKIVDDLYPKDMAKHDEFGRVCINVIRNDDISEAFEIMKRVCLGFCAKSQERGNYIELKNDIIEYINKNFKNSNISLDTMATEMGMSYYHLSRLFNEHMGMSFVGYLTEVRLEYSKALLRNTSLKVEQIAEMSGFLESNSFIRVFKKYYAITPGRYRKENS